MTQIELDAEYPVWAPWTPPGRQATILRGPDGRLYDLMIAAPSGAAPEGGWPCMVVLDGDRFFGPFSGMAEALWHRPAKTGVEPMVVLGVAGRYVAPDGRSRDFTSSPSPEGDEASYGGGEAFRRFLFEEVLGVAAHAVPIDPARLALFGHSLAGLFVLETLENHPDAFARWISISPSLWWRTPATRIGRDSLFVGCGEKEPARDMSSRISDWAAPEGPGGGSRFAVAEGADHGSAPFNLAPDVLRHAVRR